MFKKGSAARRKMTDGKMLAATIRAILWQTPNSLSLTPERVSHMSDPDLERSPNTHENNWSLSLHSKVKVVCFLEKWCPLPVFTREFTTLKQRHYIRYYWTVLEIICVIITSWKMVDGSKKHVCLRLMRPVREAWCTATWTPDTQMDRGHFPLPLV